MSKYPNLNQPDDSAIENVLSLIDKHYSNIFNLNALNAYPQGDYFDWFTECLDRAKNKKSDTSILTAIHAFLNQHVAETIERTDLKALLHKILENELYHEEDKQLIPKIFLDQSIDNLKMSLSLLALWPEPGKHTELSVRIKETIIDFINQTILPLYHEKTLIQGKIRITFNSENLFANILQTSNIFTFFLTFNEDNKQQVLSTKQLGYCEKIATGKATPYMGLTFLDMLRCARHLKLRAEGRKERYVLDSDKRWLKPIYLGIDVVNLSSLKKIDPDYRQPYLLINLDGHENWAFASMNSQQITYSGILNNEEKQQLEKIFPNYTLNEGISQNPIESGYCALAALDKETQPLLDDPLYSSHLLFNPNSDFWGLRTRLLKLLFAPTKDLKYYILRPGYQGLENAKHYFTSACMHYLEKTSETSLDRHLKQTPTLRFSVDQLVIIDAVSSLGLLNIDELKGLKSYDLCQLLELIKEHDLSKTTLSNLASIVRRFRIPGFYAAMPYFEAGQVENISKEPLDTSEFHFAEPKNLYIEDKNSASLLLDKVPSLEYLNTQKISVSIPDGWGGGTKFITVKIFLAKIIQSAFGQSFLKLKTSYYGSFSLVSKKKLGSREEPSLEDILSAMVVSLFAHTRKSHLEIHTHPLLGLNQQERDFIVTCMNENPYITDITLQAPDDHDLMIIYPQLKAICARNAWLANNYYVPTLGMDFWKEAIRYLLSAMAESMVENTALQTCFKEMGLQGLEALLTFLQENMAAAKVLTKDKMLSLHIDCEAQDYDAYLKKLTNHLDTVERYFPFSKISLRYLPLEDTSLLGLVGALQDAEEVNCIELRLTDSTDQKLVDCITRLTDFATSYAWKKPILIPELGGKRVLTQHSRLLTKSYHELNNLIQRNRQANKPATQIRRISELNDQQCKTHFERTWPLEDVDASAQLQIQYAYQTQHQVTCQLQSQYKVDDIPDELPDETLIDIENIDKLLHDELQKYPNVLSFARLGKASDKPLQQLFHTWINANPKTNAPFVIRKMTKSAAITLLRHASSFVEGIDLEALPQGFYPLRDKDNNLVLCYEAGKNFTQTPTPFILNLNTPIHPLEQWVGNYRQLLPETLYETPFSAEHLPYLNLFCFLAATDEVTIDTFKDMLPDNLTPEELTWIEQNPALCYQALIQEETSALQTLLAQKEGMHTQNPAVLLLQLINEGEDQTQIDKITAWLKNKALSKAEYKALGQVIYQQNSTNFKSFIVKWYELETTLGQEFSTHFATSFLQRAENWNEFYTAINNIFDAMKALLKDNNKAQAWYLLVDKHMKTAQKEDLNALWNVFEYTDLLLTQRGLDWPIEQLKRIPVENMIVWLSRLHRSVNQLPQDEQSAFLKHLHQFDLTHGGVHYALNYDGFKHLDNSLELTHFHAAQPTYAPNFEIINDWPEDKALLWGKRLFAQQEKFSHASFIQFGRELSSLSKKELTHTLILLLNTTYNATGGVKSIFNIISDISEPVTKALYQASLSSSKSLNIELAALATLKWSEQLAAYPPAMLLEMVSLLHKKKQTQDLETFLPLLEQRQTEENTYLLQLGLNLAVLFNQTDPDQLSKLFQSLHTLSPLLQSEMMGVFEGLLSINWEQTSLTALNKMAWEQLVNAVEQIVKNKQNRHLVVEKLLSDYKRSGIELMNAIELSYRTLQDQDRPKQLDMLFGREKVAEIWSILSRAVCVPHHTKASDELNELVQILPTFDTIGTVNELDFFFNLLKTTRPEIRYNAKTLGQLVQLLRTDDNNLYQYPFSLLSILLHSDLGRIVQGMHVALTDEFVQALTNHVLNIKYGRDEQILLCHILVQNYTQSENITLFQAIITKLDTMDATLRLRMLQTLNNNLTDMWAVWDNIQLITDNGLASTELWLTTYSHETQALLKWTNALIQCDEQLKNNPQKCKHLLNVLAFSTLDKGLRDSEIYQLHLQRKANKLAARLITLSEEELAQLVNLYPTIPSPDTDQLTHIIKIYQRDKTPLADLIQRYHANPYPEPRLDYGKQPAIRRVDIDRILGDLQKQGSPLTPEQVKRIKSDLDLLQAYQEGKRLVDGKPVSDLSKEALQTAYKHFDQKENRIELLAILFEVMARTTKKYPHLAQQLALISNEVCLDGKHRVIKMQTGEGKSHYAALRAAVKVTENKQVSICEPKVSLAQRDVIEYQPFFSYLELSLKYLDTQSSLSDLDDADVHYTTLSNRSLLDDRLAWEGTPSQKKPEERVALIDEYDFVRLVENASTQYNFAIQNEDSALNQMVWFYQTLNSVYDTFRSKFEQNKIITEGQLNYLSAELERASRYYPNRRAQLAEIMKDSITLIRYLRAAHLAAQLKEQTDYIVKTVPHLIGQELYLMDEVIPLSQDNQPMPGTSFSHGVHQLLSVRLMDEANKKGAHQLIYFQPENQIVSSQIAQNREPLFGETEGFTATLSDHQAAYLFNTDQTQVLSVPTNRPDLRHWHEPQFCDNENDHWNRIIEQIKKCIKNKQSILLSAKNDASVKKLDAKLKLQLTPEEYKQIVAFTNDQDRNASDVLQDKFKREQWLSGVKQRGVALIASGLARGDNPEVDATIIYEPTDKNETLQKGGRVARNGSDGEVFQIYHLAEMNEEIRRLKPQLAHFNPGLAKKLEQDHAKTDGKTQLSYLQTLRDALISTERLTYNLLVAEYCTWGMSIISSLADDEKEKVQKIWAKQQQQLPNEWLQIVAKPQSTIEKITEIQEVIKKYADNLSQASTMDKVFNFSEQHLKINSNDLLKTTPTDKKQTYQSIRNLPSDMRLGDWLKYEAMAKTLPDEDRPRFEEAIAGTFQHLATSENGKVLFERLLSKTMSYWEKNHRQYKLGLFSVWVALFLNADTLTNRKDLIEACLDQPGKSWFELLSVLLCANVLTNDAFFKPKGRNVTQQLINAIRNPKRQKKQEHKLLFSFYLKALERHSELSFEEAQVCYLFAQAFNLPEERTIKQLSFILKNRASFNLFVRHKSDLSHNNLLRLVRFLAKSPAATPLLPTILSSISKFPSKHHRKTCCKAIIQTGRFLLETEQGYRLFKSLLEKLGDEPQENVIKTWSKLTEKADKLPPSLYQILDEELSIEMLEFVLHYSSQQLEKHGNKLVFALQNINKDETNRSERIDFFISANENEPISLEDSEACYRLLTVFGITDKHEQLRLLPQLLKNSQHFALFKANKAILIPETLEQLLNFDAVEKENILPLLLSSMSQIVSEDRGLYCEAVIKAAPSESTSQLLLILQSQHPLPLAFIQQFPDALKKLVSEDDRTRLISKIVHLWNHSTLLPQHPKLTTSLLYSNLIPHYIPRNGEGIKYIDYLLSFMQKRIDMEPEFLDFENISQRVTIMLALKNDTLLCEEDKEWKWNNQQNSNAIQYCITEYLSQAKSILSNNNDEDLSLEQYKKIVCLAKELEVLAPSPTALVPTTTLITTLQAQLNRYETDTSWSRSALRNQELAAFQNELSHFTQNDNSTHFEQLLDLIRTQKKQVIEEDRELNITRSSWFKHNRKGYSRYLDTLNQMRDLIMKEWLDKNETIQHLPKYLPTIEKDLLEAQTQLIEGVKNAILELDSGFSLTTLFSKGLLADLKSFLPLLDTQKISVEQINRYETKLPAHLKPLMKEVSFQLTLSITLQKQAEVISSNNGGR